MKKQKKEKKTVCKKVVHKNHNHGTMTEAQFKSFIISKLRLASMFWKPKNECIKKCRVGRGRYKCENCGSVVDATVMVKGKRKKNFFADHIEPIVCTEKGWQGWSTWIERCFVEVDGYQGLCSDCHSAKTALENNKRKEGA